MNHHHDPISTIHDLDTLDDLDHRIDLGQPVEHVVSYPLGKHRRTRTVTRISTARNVSFSPVPTDWGVTTTVRINGKLVTLRCQPA